MIRPLLCLPLAALLLGVAPAHAEGEDIEKAARKLHAQMGGDYCQSLDEAYDAEDAYQSWTFSYPIEWSEDEQEITLIRIWCMSGAYNEVHAYYTYRDFEGLAPVAFAAPAFEAEYENDDMLDGKLLSLKVVGMNAKTFLVNSQFDPEERNILAHSLWRGMGDASDTGIWVFNEGTWTLKYYEIDASYDEESNSEVVVSYE